MADQITLNKTMVMCSKCKHSLGEIRVSRTKRPDGYITQYMRCRRCNNLDGRRYYRNNRTKVRAIIDRSISRYPEKQAARMEVAKALRLGELVKPKACPLCLSSTDRIEAHHSDYSQPLKITWLCSKCHSEADGRKRRLAI